MPVLPSTQLITDTLNLIKNNTPHLALYTSSPNEGGGAKVQNNIKNITISSEVDGERWLRRLTDDSEVVSHGLVPKQQYVGGN